MGSEVLWGHQPGSLSLPAVLPAGCLGPCWRLILRTRTWWVLEGLFWFRFWEGGGACISSQLPPALPSLCCGLQVPHCIPGGAWHPLKNNLPCLSIALFSNRSRRAAVEVVAGCLYLLSLHAPTHEPCGGGQQSQSTIRCILTQLCILAVGFLCLKSVTGKGSRLAAEGARCTAWDPPQPRDCGAACPQLSHH